MNDCQCFETGPLVGSFITVQVFFFVSTTSAGAALTVEKRRAGQAGAGCH